MTLSRLLFLMLLLSGIGSHIQAQSSQVRALLSDYYWGEPNEVVDSAYALWKGRIMIDTTLAVSTVVRACGKRFYRLSHHEILDCVTEDLFNNAGKVDFDTASVFQLLLSLRQRKYQPRNLFDDIWTFHHIGLYPTSNSNLYLQSVDSIFKRNRATEEGVFGRTIGEVFSLLSQQFTGKDKYNGYMYFFYHLLSRGDSAVVMRYVGQCEEELKADLLLPPLERATAYIGLAKLINTIAYEKEYSKSIQLLSIAQKYLTSKDITFKYQLSITGLIAESFSNLPGVDAKKRALGVVHSFYQSQRVGLSEEQSMQCYVLLLRHLLNVFEALEFETGEKEADIDAIIYAVSCYKYFEKRPGVFSLMAGVNAIKSLRYLEKYREMASVAYRSLSLNYYSLNYQTDNLALYLEATFGFADYYLGEEYSMDHDNFLNMLREMVENAVISEEGYRTFVYSIQSGRSDNKRFHELGISGDHTYFLSQIELMEFIKYPEELLSPNYDPDYEKVADEATPFSRYYLRHIIKFKPDLYFDNRGYNSYGDAARDQYVLMAHYSDNVPDIQYWLGYQRALSTNELEIHAKRLEIYQLELQRNEIQQELTTARAERKELDAQVLALTEKSDSLKLANAQQEENLSQTTSELGTVIALNEQLEREKTEQVRLNNELTSRNRVLLVVSIIAISLLLTTLAAFFRIVVLKNRAHILSYTNDQLAHFAKKVPSSIVQRLRKLIPVTENLQLNRELGRIMEFGSFFDLYYAQSKQSKTSIEEEVNLVKKFVDIEYGEDGQETTPSKRIILSPMEQGLQIPKFVVFNIVYNSFFHGSIWKLSEGKTELVVNGSGLLKRIAIIDNGVPGDEVSESSKSGLQYVRNRVKSWNGVVPSSFSAGKRSSTNGYQVKFRLIQWPWNTKSL